MSACPRCRGFPCWCPVNLTASIVLQPDEKPLTVRRCDNCDHWSAVTQIMGGNEAIGFLGSCRRRSPILTFSPGHPVKTRWPETEDSERCGDWEVQTQ